MTRTKIIYGLVYFFLAVGILFQCREIVPTAWQDLASIRGTMGQSARWRSANYYGGMRFANYIEFLNNVIPEKSAVLIPPQDQGNNKLIGNTPTMQFYLGPRKVFNCSTLDEKCPVGFAENGTYVLIANGYPPGNGFWDQQKQALNNPAWGVYLPADAYIPNPAGKQAGRFLSTMEIGEEAAQPFFWLFMLSLAGFFLVDFFGHELAEDLKIMIGFGIVMILLTLGLSCSSLLGWVLNRINVWTISIGLLLLSIALHIPGWKRNSGRIGNNHWKNFIGWFDPWRVAILALGLLAMTISVGKSYHITDEIVLWGVKGYGIASSGTILDITAWGTNTVNYPIHIPLVISSMKILFNDSLPSSKAIFSIYYIALLLVVYRFLLQSDVNKAMAGLATTALATMPMVYQHGLIGYANLPFSFYMVSAILMTIQAEKSGNGGSYFLAGFLFLSSAWVRPEGLPIALIIIIGLILASRKTRHSFLNRYHILLISPSVVYAFFWAFLQMRVYSSSVNKSTLAITMVNQILSGNIHLEEAWFIVSSMIIRLFDVHVWGICGIILAISMLVWIFKKPDRFEDHYLILSGLIVITMICGMYYVTTFDLIHPMNWWINTGMDRMMMPGILLLWSGCVILSSRALEEENRFPEREN